MFQTKAVEKIKTHILCSVTFFRKSCRLSDNVEKYGKAIQATDDSMAHAHCMPDTKGYKHTLSICNTSCFPTATMVTRTRLECYVKRTLPGLFIQKYKVMTSRVAYYEYNQNKLENM